MGIIIGKIDNDEIDEKITEYAIYKPVILTQTGFFPLLDMVEENSKIDIKLKDVLSRKLFTPKPEIVNRYNAIFGSGITIQKSSLVLPK